MRRWLREPMLHFLLLGAAIFAAFGWTSREAPPAESTIVVSAGQVESLATAFSRTWQRPPSAAELDGLVADWVREEVYYREALALGLDRDDVVVRRRLRQKLEFLAADLSGAVDEPRDEELRAHLEAHPERFSVPGRISFAQVPLRGPDGVRALLAELEQAGPDADPAAHGAPSLLPHALEDVTLDAVAHQFGGGLAERLAGLPVGRWAGPVESAYGAHVVVVRDRTPARPAALDEARDAVRRDLAEARRSAAREAFYRSLRGRWDVRVERPVERTAGRTPEGGGSS